MLFLKSGNLTEWFFHCPAFPVADKVQLSTFFLHQVSDGQNVLYVAALCGATTKATLAQESRWSLSSSLSFCFLICPTVIAGLRQSTNKVIYHPVYRQRDSSIPLASHHFSVFLSVGMCSALEDEASRERWGSQLLRVIPDFPQESPPSPAGSYVDPQLPEFIICLSSWSPPALAPLSAFPRPSRCFACHSE